MTSAALDALTLLDLRINDYSPTTQAFLLGATLTAPCSHTHISSDQSAINQATAAIRTALGRLAPKPAATQILTLRPVTAEGRPAPGWSVESAAATPDPANPIDCGNDPDYASTSYPSRSAVDPNIYDCYPEAAIAHNCWPTNDGSLTMLCIFDVQEQTLQYQAYTAPVSAVTPEASPSPVKISLDNGQVCTIRIGGSVDRQQDHPDWFIFYFCPSGAVWAVDGDGINRGTIPWTVQVGPPDGHLTKHTITKAFVVGNRQLRVHPSNGVSGVGHQ